MVMGGVRLCTSVSGVTSDNRVVNHVPVLGLNCSGLGGHRHSGKGRDGREGREEGKAGRRCDHDELHVSEGGGCMRAA